MKKIYIAGAITNNPGYEAQFLARMRILKREGHAVMNPALLCRGFEYEEYMKVCFSMLDVCDSVYFLKGWETSDGAKREHQRALMTGKEIFYEVDELKKARNGKTHL